MKSYELKNFNSDSFIFLEEDVSSGSRPRVLVRHKDTRQKSLIKTYKNSPRELWAEMFTSKLGTVLPFDVQVVALRRADKKLAHRIKSDYGDALADDWNGLVAQIQYLLPRGSRFNFGSQYIKRSNSQSELFTLEEVENALRNSFPTTDDLIESFARMVIFDFVIGNSDRHRDNWAVSISDKFPRQLQLFGLSSLEKQKIKKLRHFATLFDHGDSVLYRLEDSAVERMCRSAAAREEHIMRNVFSYLNLENNRRGSLFEVVKEKTTKSGRHEDKWRRNFKKIIQEVTDAFNYYEVGKLLAQMPGDEGLCYNSYRKDALMKTTIQRVELLRSLTRR